MLPTAFTDKKLMAELTAKMLLELGYPATAATVLQRYADLIDIYIADPRDIDALAATRPRATLVPADIMMVTLDDRKRLARTVMDVTLGKTV